MSIKRNFGYNLILTSCNFVFPLIVYPYISRVLLVGNLGLCNYIDSIINYFILFALAGISSYGVREIARCRGNENRLSIVFSNLVSINLLLTCILSIGLLICIYWVPYFKSYSSFLWIGLLKLISSVFLIEWFIQGMELFKYITIRSIIIRVVFIFSVFIFVHKESDAIVYFALLCGTSVINAIVNWRYAMRFVNFKIDLSLFKTMINSIISFGCYRILTSMYTSFNVIFLGFTTDDIQVGYFTTATKLITLLISIFTAFTTVMVPRVSSLIKNKDYSIIKLMSDKIISTLLILSLPLFWFCLIYANEIILIISGPGYGGAVTPFRIIIGLVAVIGLEQIFIQQFLMASYDSNKCILVLSSLGAIVGITLNLILTPIYKSIGTSIAWACSEVAILILSTHYMRRIFNLIPNYKLLSKIFLSSMIYIIPLLVIKYVILNNWISIIVSSITMIILLIINAYIIIGLENLPIKTNSFPKLFKH